MFRRRDHRRNADRRVPRGTRKPRISGAAGCRIRPTSFIFGYGSLINTASRNSTATKAVPAIPVRVSAAFGFIRTWSDHSPSGFTALGLRRPDQGETAMTING